MTVGKTYGDDQRDAYGVMQTIMPDKVEDITQILKDMEKYVDAIRQDAGSSPEILAVMEEECQNKHAQCAYWKTLGECLKNPTYMKINCGPVCQSCDHIGMLTRCPLDPNEPNAWEAGDLNAYFYNLTTHEAYKQYEPKVWSRPSYAGGDTILTADYKIGPWVVTLENFLTQDEADRMIELGTIEGYERSADTGKINPDGTFGKNVNERRTSHNAWCLERCYRDPVSQDIMARIENITNIPDINQEYLQLLRYEPGQFYRTHHDYVENQVNRQSGPRMLTVFLYLNDVLAGGATNFPHLDITVYPKRGRVLIWPSVQDSDPNIIDGRTKHQALEVEKGIKYAANAWVHMRDYQGPHKRQCQ
uniref:Fe2OG dioxygenase domain-containing protein n=1 Tax=Cyclophora tenuis TaxID=216820 RepID=A0A7S1GNL2_CYCTE